MSQPASSSPSSTEVFCVFCGSGNPRANGRCSQCGRDLFVGTSESDPQAEVAQSNTESPAPEARSTDHYAIQAHPRGINTKQMIVLWYGAVACVVVAVLSGSSTVGALVAVLVLHRFVSSYVVSSPQCAKKDRCCFCYRTYFATRTLRSRLQLFSAALQSALQCFARFNRLV